MQADREVACPTCRTSVLWNKDSPYRPFCSKKCRLIDFGEWANEEKRIAGDPSYSASDDHEQTL